MDDNCCDGTYSGDAKCSAGTLLSSGQFSFKTCLASISSLGGIQWGFGLDFLSDNGIDGALGKSFNFTQNIHFEEMANGDAVLISGDNTHEMFADTGSGTYSSSDNNTRAVLERTGSGVNEELTLLSSSGNTSRFYGFDPAIDTPGVIKSVTDRYGNTQTYTWTTQGGVAQLASITDSYGRTVEYRYYGAAQGFRLREIEDFLERKLNFQYDDFDHLVAVVTPSILRAAPGNTFPGGTAYVFEYDVNNPNPARRDDLIRIYYPNQATPYIDIETRTVDVDAVYANATPRYNVTYNAAGQVVSETVGDPADDVGGTYQYSYQTSGLPANLIDPTDSIVSRANVTDRNGNKRVYDFNVLGQPVRFEIQANRDKNSLQTGPYVTWTKYNTHSQPLLVVMPEGDSVEYEYEDGNVAGIGEYAKRIGLLIRETHKPGNPIGIPSRPGSSGQTELTRRYFYDPIYNQQVAVIERRGNPIDAPSTYFQPQNGGTTPTDADRSRYATFTFFDYQKNTTSTIINDAALQQDLGLNATQIQALIDHVNDQMIAEGLPSGFETDLGDINGDGTGDGAASGLPAAKMIGNIVKVQHPSVRLIGSSTITTQVREELFTNNDRGQTTTHTDPEGNLTVMLRYPESDPEGNGQFTSIGASNKQYGRVKEVHVDANPDHVMTLVGEDGDLEDFIPGLITRTNTPGVYQDLTTRHEGSTVGAGGGCASCAYDPLGNPLAMTDPRGFTTHSERNELGTVFRTISPAPYEYKVETHYDANRNVTRVDTEDQIVRYDSDDPTSAGYAHFTPTGSGSTAHVPMNPGPGGSVRPGWFTNLYEYDILDNKIEDDIDATGSTPSSLITQYEYDANQNLIKTTKPEGNTVEYDYDERNLQIATRVGYDANLGEPGAVTISAYDKNSNLIQMIGASARGGVGNQLTATIDDAFGSGNPLVHTGDYVLENIYDGFDRVIQSIDAVGNVVLSSHDPNNRTIEVIRQGPIGGPTPTDRIGAANVDLAGGETRFDEAGRSYESQNNVFVASGTTIPSGRDVTHTGGGLEANSTSNGHTATETLVLGGVAQANSSYTLTRTVYDRASRVVEYVADNTGVTTNEYDGASRAIRTVDALQAVGLENITKYKYDANDNTIAAVQTERCTITQPTVPDETFRMTMRYDSLDRQVVSAKQGADGVLDHNLNECCTWPICTEALIYLAGYDSRSNATVTIDPRANTEINLYDGANRLTQILDHVRQDGQGSNPPAANQTFLPYGGATIRTTTNYDTNSRVVQLIDDNGGVTTYAYDTLDRQVVMEFHDGSQRVNVYNDASDVTQHTDENGSVFNNTFDSLGRRTDVAITPAAGVVGTDAQSFEYDGLSRYTKAVDSIGVTNATVQMFYDSASRAIEDSQTYLGNTRNVTNDAFESYPVTEVTFPNGRQTANTYDLLYRRTDVAESGGSSIASWQFFGPSRAVETVLVNGLICTAMNNARNRSAVQEGLPSPDWGDRSSDRLGYDGAGRMITKRYLAGGINDSTFAYNNTTAIVGQTTEYDLSSNKLFERQMHAESRSSLYEPYGSNGAPQGGYDSLDRLRQYQRGVLDSTGGRLGQGGGSIVTSITLPNTDSFRGYDLDGLGNWKNTTFTPAGGNLTNEVRQHNKLNQITETDDGTPIDFNYDGTTGESNGNLADDGVRLCEWDALNRLKVVRRKSDGMTIGESRMMPAVAASARSSPTAGCLGRLPTGPPTTSTQGPSAVRSATARIRLRCSMYGVATSTRCSSSGSMSAARRRIGTCCQIRCTARSR
ncbi:MAG: hypothetical protein GC159_17780 [Phycisphaera sp.]|nr:hypothetical protein [Phycisphaera sp.]